MDPMNDKTKPETVWIEVLGRHREVALRQRIDAASITLGRAYDNDVVLDDPHVAAHHLRIARGEDGRWIAEDLGSRNGVYAEGETKRRERIALSGAEALRIGHTVVRLRSSAEAVPEEQPLGSRRSPWPFALGAIAIVFVLELLGLWLNETAEPKLIRYLTPVLTVVAIVAVWTTLWSVLSRVFSGHARFGLHLAILGAGLLAYSLYDQIGEFGAFALSWTALTTYQYVIGWLILAAMCFFHLRAIGPTRLPAKAIALAALAALGITMQSLKLSEWRSTYGQAVTLQRLEPPSLRLVGAENPQTFFTRVAALKATLDQARSKEPEEGAESEAEE
ncbi:FHA domain-containing protein [Dokdonella sp.]|uniref:FHA domain-containing protein n=1 Tax=Dokdonella sp. TaxID=2291710 RepID=UPI001B20E7C6|nr:FHA domain-containing protein [Dokdonella sp.]MBO9661418.1 FHA domain-containing protein [Dokdonella sp.]